MYVMLLFAMDLEQVEVLPVQFGWTFWPGVPRSSCTPL